MAARSSRTSAPRHSPTIKRSGRMRRACRTSSARSTTPAPSRLPCLLWRPTAWGCAGLNSAASSTVTRRSPGSLRARRVESNVVLPVPVAPLMRKFIRPVTILRSVCPINGSTAPEDSSSSSENSRFRLILIDSSVPVVDSGGKTACTRNVSSRTSTQGLPSSSRRPPAATRRAARLRTSESEAKRRDVSDNPLPLSTQTAWGPLTRISVTVGSSARC